MSKLKEIIIVAAVGVFSFPILYGVILIANGIIRIEYGTPKGTVEEEKKLQIVKRTEKTDSILVTQSRTFQAIQNEKTEIETERQRLKDQQDRMDLLQKELEEKQQSISQERSKLESLVTKSDSLENKKFKNQAKVYMAMKPLEAAQIIETLPDEHAAKILNAMNDDRQKAKILASLSTEKAARVTSELGASR
jgi:flagellar motility protein MotE (MotC chaperone)